MKPSLVFAGLIMVNEEAELDEVADGIATLGLKSSAAASVGVQHACR
jgi:hypothetical protein